MRTPDAAPPWSTPLDSEGNRIPETEKKEPPKPTVQRRRKRRRGGGMMGSGSGGGSAMGGVGKKSNKSQAELAREAKEENERRRRELRARLAGDNKLVNADELAKEAAAGPPPKEITKGLRWVALTATLDHAQVLANYRKALKNPSVAKPYYLRLDVQRQEMMTDGSWSEWEDVASKRNLEILDNLPEVDEELTPDNVRPENLNDPLPFLKAGLWEKVHIGSLVPEEKKAIVEVKVPTADEGGMMGNMAAMMMSSSGSDSTMGGMGGSGAMMMGGSGSMSGAMMGMAGMSDERLHDDGDGERQRRRHDGRHGDDGRQRARASSRSPTSGSRKRRRSWSAPSTSRPSPTPAISTGFGSSC